MKLNCKPPKTLLNWLNANAEKIVEVDYGGGYNTPSSYAHDILLAPTYHSYDDNCHTIIEATAAETLKQLRNIKHFTCPQCYDT